MNSLNQENKPLSVDWRDLDVCCLDVSLNNRYQTGIYLAMMIEWINKRFKSCLLILGDTLHRHNLGYEYPDQAEAYAVSLKMGDRWLKENAESIKKLRIPYTLIRSDDWLAFPEFESTHKDLCSFYRTDKAFSESIERDIQKFSNRRSDLPLDFVRSSSLAYLLEETAADILIGRKNGPLVHLYSGKWPECYFNLMERAESLPVNLRGLEKCVFKRVSPGKIMGAVNTSKNLIPIEEPYRERA